MNVRTPYRVLGVALSVSDRFDIARSTPRTITNAKDWARPFTARLLEPGLCSYEDSGCGKILLRKETIDRCVRSFIGRPVVVRRRNGKHVHQNANPGNMKAIGHGYVTDVFFNSNDGWWYAKGVVDTDEAVKAINEVGKCSCAYAVTGPTRPGGQWHDIGYDEEITEFSGEHLAVVDNPRYEEATIMLNSKKTNAMNVFKWLPKKKAAAPAAAEPAAAPAAADAPVEVDGATKITLVNAKGEEVEVTIADLAQSHANVAEALEVIENAKKNGVEIGMDDDVVCNGKTYKMNALVQAFDKWATDNPKAAGTAGGAASAANRENAKTDEPPGGKKTDHFRVLLNASATPQEVVERSPMGTLAERLENGKKMFGTPAKK